MACFCLVNFIGGCIDSYLFYMVVYGVIQFNGLISKVEYFFWVSVVYFELFFRCIMFVDVGFVFCEVIWFIGYEFCLESRCCIYIEVNCLIVSSNYVVFEVLMALVVLFVYGFCLMWVDFNYLVEVFVFRYFQFIEIFNVRRDQVSGSVMYILVFCIVWRFWVVIRVGRSREFIVVNRVVVVMELFFSGLDMAINDRVDVIVVYIGFINCVNEVYVEEFIFMAVFQFLFYYFQLIGNGVVFNMEYGYIVIVVDVVVLVDYFVVDRNLIQRFICFIWCKVDKVMLFFGISYICFVIVSRGSLYQINIVYKKDLQREWRRRYQKVVNNVIFWDFNFFRKDGCLCVDKKYVYVVQQ